MEHQVEPSWLQQARCGQFSALPDPFCWYASGAFSHLLNGYKVAEIEGCRILGIWANERLAEAEHTRTWQGTALELWCCLFYEHRRYRHMDEGDPEGDDLALLDLLCQNLRTKLQALTPEEHARILTFIDQGL